MHIVGIIYTHYKVVTSLASAITQHRVTFSVHQLVHENSMDLQTDYELKESRQLKSRECFNETSQ